MEYHVLTLIPEALTPYFDSSILGRAQKEGFIKIQCHQIRDYAINKHKSVDDTAYGGGPGMVMRPEVIATAIRDLKSKYPVIERVILLSPRGRALKVPVIRELGHYKGILFVCGRYEGIDQRAIDLVIDEELSIGDYVITGGELAAAIVVDALARFIPGVVGDDQSPLNDSFEEGILEYPHYTRPAVFEGIAVPEVLLSGDHAKIKAWREAESLKITQKIRPDLLIKTRSN
jgi:tRNA (guanine37-N1)-methyltransferase